MSHHAPSGPERDQPGLTFAHTLGVSLVSGIVLINFDKGLAHATAEARRLLGLPGDETSAVDLEELPEAVLSLARSARAAGGSLAVQELRVSIPVRGNVLLRAKAIPWPGEAVAGRIALVLGDVTSAKSFEQHLQQLDRLASLGTLAASLAHEIKNALVAGRAFIDLLLEKNQDAELAEIVKREIGRIEAIVSRMLRFPGDSKGEFGPVHVHETLERSLQLVTPHLEGRAIAVTKRLAAPIDVVEGDQYELQQAFLNVLLNAVDAMGRDGALSLSTELVAIGAEPQGLREGNGSQELVITIADTGPGIDPEDMPHLFEPFRTTKAGGTGLGLVITKRILHEHNGDITAESQLGRGATFCITLPIQLR